MMHFFPSRLDEATPGQRRTSARPAERGGIFARLLARVFRTADSVPSEDDLRRSAPSVAGEDESPCAARGRVAGSASRRLREPRLFDGRRADVESITGPAFEPSEHGIAPSESGGLESCLALRAKVAGRQMPESLASSTAGKARRTGAEPAPSSPAVEGVVERKESRRGVGKRSKVPPRPAAAAADPAESRRDDGPRARLQAGEPRGRPAAGGSAIVQPPGVTDHRPSQIGLSGEEKLLDPQRVTQSKGPETRGHREGGERNRSAKLRPIERYEPAAGRSPGASGESRRPPLPSTRPTGEPALGSGKGPPAKQRRSVGDGVGRALDVAREVQPQATDLRSAQSVERFGQRSADADLGGERGAEGDRAWAKGPPATPGSQSLASAPSSLAEAGPRADASAAGAALSPVANGPVPTGAVPSAWVPAEHPAGESAAHRALVERMAARISQAFDQGRRTATIRLDPPELGEVRVVLSKREGKLRLVLSCSKPSTYQQLQHQIDRLDRRLLEAGVDHAGVDLAQSDGGQRGEQGAERRFEFTAAKQPEVGPRAAPLNLRRRPVSGLDVVA